MKNWLIALFIWSAVIMGLVTFYTGLLNTTGKVPEQLGSFNTSTQVLQTVDELQNTINQTGDSVTIGNVISIGGTSVIESFKIILVVPIFMIQLITDVATIFNLPTFIIVAVIGIITVLVIFSILGATGKYGV